MSGLQQPVSNPSWLEWIVSGSGATPATSQFKRIAFAPTETRIVGCVVSHVTAAAAKQLGPRRAAVFCFNRD